MAEHEPCIGETSEWYTPPEIFAALRLTFDLDPCSPGPGHWVPAKKIYTKEDDGLAQPWLGLVFMNPPFGGRNGHVPWMRKFFAHGNGIMVVRAYTSSAWWHEEMPKAELILFPRGKTKFVRPDSSVGAAPGHGVVLVGMGEVACEALRRCGLGMIWNRTLAEPTPNLAAPSIVMSEHRRIMRELHDQALVEDRSGAWRIRLAVGLTCPFCDRIVHARDVDHAYARLRFVCQHCRRGLIEIECVGGSL